MSLCGLIPISEGESLKIIYCMLLYMRKRRGNTKAHSYHMLTYTKLREGGLARSYRDGWLTGVGGEETRSMGDTGW